MADMENLNVEALDQVAGGASSGSWKKAVVIGDTTYYPHYLALRSAPAYNDKNELAKLYHGDALEVKPSIQANGYIWARAKGMEGWVNRSYVKY